MSDNVSESSIDMQDMSVVESLLDDKELRKLPVGSNEFKAAVAAKAAKTDANTDSADSETDQDDESSEDDESDEKEESKTSKPKKKGVEKRINELVKEREALKKELEIAKINRGVDAQIEAVAEQTPFEKAKPKFGDFDNIADYQEALVDWKLEKKEHDHTVAQEQRELKSKQETFISAWAERENKFKGTVDDYDDYINKDSLDRLQPGQTALAYIAESDFGPEVLYALLTDEELSKKFMAASDVKKVGILSRLEANFESDEPAVSKTKATVSKAPSPSKSLPKGKAVATSKSIYDASLSFAEYNRLMDERDRAKSRK